MPAHALLPTPCLLDGATGTELGRRGVDIALPLWSARALMDAPDIVAAIHHDYLRAGADAITTNTFRTHRRSLAAAGAGARARELTFRAVDLARQARDAINPQALVLGSVSPLEDCYRPDLAPGERECRAEHAAMIEWLVEAGADLLLIETMNNQRESLAAAAEARRQAPGRWMISFCCAGDDPPGTLLSGEPLIDLLPEISGALAVGVNCVPAPAIETQVRLLRSLAPADVRIIAYANIGVADADGSWVCTDAIDPHRYASYARRWLEAGATIVGGCCGTTPAHIEALRASMDAAVPVTPG